MTSARAPRYLYGIVRAGSLADPHTLGLDDEPVEEVAKDGVAAVVSRLSGVVEATRERLGAHLRVLQELAERTTVLPMRFGMVVPDDDALRERVLAPRKREFLGLLRDLDGMLEIDVKAYFRDEAVLPEIVAENPPIRELDARIRRLPRSASYYDRIRLGELVVAAMSRKAEREGRELLRRLAPAAARVQAGPLGTERMVLNAAFLVPRARLGAFDRAVAGAEAEAGGRLRLRSVGPLPPSSFASVDAEQGAGRDGRRRRR
ncbi:MAG: GvpL/GvpF family gas vesicle protein [Actinomycetota bacterium]